MRAPNKIFLLDSKPSGELEPEDQVSPFISDTGYAFYECDSCYLRPHLNCDDLLFSFCGFLFPDYKSNVCLLY